MTGLFFAHSGLRFLVLFVGIAAVLYFAYGMTANRVFDRPANILRAAFVGLLDLQALLGIGMVVMGLWYPMLAGHLGLMIIALVVAHAAAVVAKRAPSDKRKYTILFGAYLVTLLLIAGGILAIGRPIFGTGRPSLLG